MGKANNRAWKLVLVAVVAAAAALINFQSTEAAIGINSQISFQGKVVNTNGTNLPDGTYNMRFKVYQDGSNTGSGSTLKWTETRLVSNTQAVTVTAGTFQVNLGSVNAFNSSVDWNQDTLWLSFEVGGTGSTPTWDGEMTPYIRLTSVPYALNAGMVGGLTASQLVQLTPSAQQTGSINVSGNIQTGGVLQAATLDTPASGVLTVGGTNTTAVTLSKNTTITSGQTLSVGGQTVFSGAGVLQAAAISSSVAYTNLTQVGTITSGTWNASAIAPAYGGTGITSYTVGDLLYASGTAALSKLAAVATGSCLKSAGTGTAPTWGTCTTGNSLQTAYNNGSSISTTAANGIVVAAAAAPTADMFTIRNTGFGVATAGVSALQISYVGGSAAVEASAQRIDLTPGGTSGSTWNGVRIAGSTAASGVTENAIKVETITGGTGTENAIQIGTGWDNILSYNGSSVINGSGVVQVAFGGTGLTSYTTGDLLFASGATTIGKLAAVAAGSCLKSNGTSASPVWGTCSGGSAVTTVGTFSTTNTAANGATIVNGTDIVFQAASTSAPGMITAGAQTLAGAKTFNGQVIASGALATTGTASLVSLVAQGDSAYSQNIAEFRNGGGAIAGRFSNGGYFEINSGFGSNFTTNTNFTANRFSVTSSATTGSGIVLQAANMELYGTVTSGTTTLIGFNFPSVTPVTNNTFYGITFGTGYNATFLVGPNVILDGNGAIQPAGLTGNATNYTVGDMLYATGGTTMGRLAASTSGNCVKSNGTAAAPVYGACISSVGTFIAGNTNTNGATISGNAITLTSAGVSAPGIVNIADQTFSGTKTFQTGVNIGNPTTDATQSDFQLDSYNQYADTGTCDTTTNQGAMYYNTTTNAIRACINSSWEDLASTGGLGIILFGVVLDTGTAPGDLQSLTTANTATGPCQPYRASATSIGWTACSAYSSGRKVIVPAGTLTTTNATAGNYQHLCLTGTNNQPALSTSAAETTNLPTWSAASPVLCLADIRYGSANNTISNIYDTRVMTTSQKEYAYTAAGLAPGRMVVASGSKIAAVAAGTAVTNVRGVIGTTNGSTVGTNGGPNSILITAGPAFVKSTAGTAGQYIQSGTTAGFAATTATGSANVYSTLGIAQTTVSTTCSTQINCFASLFVNVNLR